MASHTAPESSSGKCPVHPQPGDFDWPSPATLECPYDFYAALRRDAPVYKLRGRNDYLVSRWEDIVSVLQRPEIFSSRNFAAAPEYAAALAMARRSSDDREANAHTPWSMASDDPPEHTDKRKVGLQMVAPDRLRGYEPRIREIAETLVDGFAGRGRAEFRAEFAEQFPLLVICHVLGLPVEDVDRLRVWSHLEGHGARFMTSEQIAAQSEPAAAAAAYMREVVQDRYQNPRDDYLSEFISARVAKDGWFDIDYIEAEAALFLLAGNATTTHFLSSAMTILLEEPNLLSRVREDRSLIPPFVEEVLRAEAPVQWILRQCTEDTEVGGCLIPRGASVLVVVASGNRDPERFEEPGEIKTPRPQVIKHHLAFGRGAHRCLGAPLARLEGVIALNVLLDRLEHLRLVPDQEVNHLGSNQFRAPSVVHIEFEARSAAA